MSEDKEINRLNGCVEAQAKELGLLRDRLSDKRTRNDGLTSEKDIVYGLFFGGVILVFFLIAAILMSGHEEKKRHHEIELLKIKGIER